MRFTQIVSIVGSLMATTLYLSEVENYEFITCYTIPSEYIKIVCDNAGKWLHLKKIIFRESQIQSFPEGFASFPLLEEIVLVRNKELKDFSNLAELKKTIKLRFEGNGISEIPESISKMEKLRTLEFSSELFTEFPKKITNLIDLHELILRNMIQIVKIPDSIKKLNHLISLDLTGNGIKKLPEKISKLTELQFLDLSDNESLSELPDCIDRLSNLYFLNLHNTKIKELPFSIAALQKLEVLFLNKTSLKFIPVQICLLPELVTLSLGENKDIKSLISTREQVQAFKKWYTEYIEQYENTKSKKAYTAAYIRCIKDLKTSMESTCQSNAFGLFNLKKLQTLSLSNELLDKYGLDYSWPGRILEKSRELYSQEFAPNTPSTSLPLTDKTKKSLVSTFPDSDLSKQTASGIYLSSRSSQQAKDENEGFFPRFFSSLANFFRGKTFLRNH